MYSSDSVKYSDIKKSGSDFTFTGKLADFSINQDWVDGYDALSNKNVKSNGFTSMWEAISSGTEEIGNDFYIKIRNYIDDIGNIDTCDLKSLKNYANILGIKNEYVDINITFPIEIERMIEIFSVNPAYLYNKEYDGVDGLSVLSNSILHYSTVEQLISSLKDKDKYNELINNIFYNTINEFLNLKTTTFDDSENGVENIEIWKTDTSKFINDLWKDDISSEYEVYKLKDSLGVAKSFSEKIYADDIIAGKRKLSDFSDIEQEVLKAEISNRKTEYGTSNSMKYHYMRLYKVMEYFRFATIAYNKAYELEEYELNENKYNILTDKSERLALLKFNYNEYEIDTDAIRKVSEWLTNYTLNIAIVRNDMKSQCQKNMMVGTKRLIIDLIRKFMLEKIDGETWSDVQNSILYSANLNKKFDVSIIEYTDPIEYFNIENKSDSVKTQNNSLNQRYWDMYNDSNNTFTDNDVLKFYNRLFEDSKKFLYNKKDGKGSSDNLYEFLSVLFESGATSNVNSDYYLSSELYTASNGTILTSSGSYALTDYEKDVLSKYSGDLDIGKTPYSNHKNTFHTSYQLHPFIQAFEEYNEAYTSVMNLVNSYSENINVSFQRLSDRLDSLGNTINFWYNWNEDFSGYSTTYEKGGSDFESKDSQDSPFDFNALQEFINYPDEYINNILNGVNEYYYDKSTGKSSLGDNDIRLEIARLQKYSDQIHNLANREIYKYGKDYSGNIYILYKDEGNRSNRNSLGDIWIRLKNHPIAFPLFDLSISPVRFNETSCISETDNTKLLDVLTTVISMFKSTYGKHFTDKSIQDGKVVPSNLGITLGSYTEIKNIECDSHGASSDVVFDYSSGKSELSSDRLKMIHTSNGEIVDFVNRRMEFKSVYNVSEVLSSVCSTYYFIDSVTNSVIPGGTSSTYTISSENNETGEIEVYSNPTGKIISVPDEEYFNSEYNEKTNAFVLNSNNSIVNDEHLFSDVTDENEYDGYTYYCTNTITNKTHPCTKRRVKFSKLFKLELEALSGCADSNGNVTFGNKTIVGDRYNGETYFSKYSTYTTSESASSVLDGGMIYEDFSVYDYKVESLGITADSSSIIMIAGSNPYYINSVKDAHGVYHTTLEKAEIIKDRSEADTIKFSDRVYRNNILTYEVSSYPVSACVFTDKYTDKYSDTIGQFYLKQNPYVLYQPYTELSGHPFTDITYLDSSSPTGSITLYGDNGNTTYYYNLKTWFDDNYRKGVRVRAVRYDKYHSTLDVEESKLNGTIELVPYDTVEFPIYLSFNDSSSINIATYSSYYSDREQRKFFDIGFSYNQKLFYMTFRNGTNEYIDSGTIIGKINERTDRNYNKTLSFYRDSSHNIEYIDSDSMIAVSKEIQSDDFHKIHIGDASSKHGIFTAFGNYDKNKKTIEIFINLFASNNVYSNKFNINLKYGLYEFDNGSKYSFKLVCTDKRLYIACTCNIPEDSDVFSNTVNGSTAGSIGSSKFGDIKKHCLDNIITILSFDIEDINSITYEESENRYILGNGSIGYFSQYSGFLGKNNVFTNPKLSSDVSFSFESEFSTLSGTSKIDFYNKYSSRIKDFTTDRKIHNFERFINFYDEDNCASTDEITGVLISDDNEYGYVVTALSGDYGNSFKFSNIGDRKIYDITRGVDDSSAYDSIVYEYSELPEFVEYGYRCMVLKSHENYPPNSIFEFTSSSENWSYVESHQCKGVHLIADSSDSHNRGGAFVEYSTASNPDTSTGMNLTLIPYHTPLSGYIKFDFNEFIDFDDSVYAFHSDGYTISEIEISSNSSDFSPVSGIAMLKFNPLTYVDDFNELPENVPYGTVFKVKNKNGLYPENSFYRYTYDKISSYWKYIKQKNIASNDIKSIGSSKTAIQFDGYDVNASNGNNNNYAISNGKYITYFDVYSGIENIQIIKNSINYSTYTYSPKPFFCGEVPYVIYPIGVFNNEFSEPNCQYKVGSINRAKNENYSIEEKPYTISFYYNHPIKSIVNTYEDNIKLMNTYSGYIYKFDVESGKVSKSSTFDAISADIKLDKITDFNSMMSETKDHIMISYWADSNKINGVLRTRKNTPDSIAENVSFVDSNGIEIDVGLITKFLSLNSIVLAEENNGDRVFISNDDGNTFKVLESSLNHRMKLIGCGVNTFYARYGNNEKVMSNDGIEWNNINDISFSNWSVFNSNGIDYIGCSEYDSDLSIGILEKEKFVNITRQLTLKGEYKFDSITVNDDRSIVCCSGLNGEHPLIVARSFFENGAYSDFEYFEFSYVRGFSFKKTIVSSDDILVSPNGGMNVLKIENVFRKSSSPTIKYIDISKSINNEINVFGGFEKINGNIVMYPSEGYSMLVFDSNNDNFYTLYSFDSKRDFSDCDSLNYGDGTEAIISPRSSDLNGVIEFNITNFKHRSDYGIVEIDEGFPILITYTKIYTYFTSQDTVPHSVYQIKFTFMNDDNNKSVSILTYPENASSYESYYKDKISNYAVYVIGNKSITYRFSSVDSSPKYTIEKIFIDKSNRNSNNDFLGISYSIPSESDKNSIYFDFDGNGEVSIYGDITSSNSDYKTKLEDVSILQLSHPKKRKYTKRKRK